MSGVRDFGKAIVGIAAVAMIGVQCINHNINGQVVQWCIIAITAMVLGADAVTQWLEQRK